MAVLKTIGSSGIPRGQRSLRLARPAEGGSTRVKEDSFASAYRQRRSAALRPHAHRVLVVDDSAFHAPGLSARPLRSADWKWLARRSNGLDALIKIEQTQPDVVTLDVEMTDMDGLSRCANIMTRYHRPVIMLSNLNQPAP